MNNIPAKKSLGQNFLKSKEAILKIIESADLHEEDVVLEVGPGKGVLTEELLKKTKQVVAVEKDDRLIELLREKFADELRSEKLVLIHGDILEINKSWNINHGIYKVVANIPYYITGQFLRTFLSGSMQPTRMVLMVQKEVAERIVARNGKESILSISVEAYGTPKYVMKVAAKYFSPEPNVDSAILLISDISKTFFKDMDEEDFFTFMKTGFAHKRKQLVGNLTELYPRETIVETFKALNISEKIRAEDISIADWKNLFLKLSA